MSRGRQFSQPGIALTAPVFYILLSLRDGDRHGYDILKHVDSTSTGRVRLGPGTLYTTLKRLTDARVVAEVSGPAHDDARRRYYRLTARGRTALDEELNRMEEALWLADRRPAQARS